MTRTADRMQHPSRPFEINPDLIDPVFNRFNVKFDFPFFPISPNRGKFITGLDGIDRNDLQAGPLIAALLLELHEPVDIL